MIINLFQDLVRVQDEAGAGSTYPALLRRNQARLELSRNAVAIIHLFDKIWFIIENIVFSIFISSGLYIMKNTMVVGKGGDRWGKINLQCRIKKKKSEKDYEKISL